MSWNYRIIYHPPLKYTIGEREFDGEAYYAIHEVYYDGNGVPEMYAIDFVIHSETLEKLEEVWDMVKESVKKDVINISFFEKNTWKWKINMYNVGHSNYCIKQEYSRKELRWLKELTL